MPFYLVESFVCRWNCTVDSNQTSNRLYNHTCEEPSPMLLTHSWPCVCVRVCVSASASSSFTYTRQPGALNHPFIWPVFPETHTLTNNPDRADGCATPAKAVWYTHTDTQIKGREPSVSAASPCQWEFGISHACHQSIIHALCLWGPTFWPTC